jgi:ribosomal protein L36
LDLEIDHKAKYFTMVDNSWPSSSYINLVIMRVRSSVKKLCDSCQIYRRASNKKVYVKC